MCIICFIGGKPSGKEVSQRKAASALVLKDGFELNEGSQTPYEAVVAYLGPDYGSKSFITRMVKETFVGVYLKRVRKANEKQYPFQYILLTDHDHLPMYPDAILISPVWYMSHQWNMSIWCCNVMVCVCTWYKM